MVALGLPIPVAVKAGVRIEWRPVRAPYDPAEQSAAGRRAAAAALASAAATEFVVPSSTDGRPRFPQGFAGSISHTERLAVAVVAPGAAAVGVDVESADVGLRVARFVLRESERRALLVPEARFTARELFAAKEAAFKALYCPDNRDDLLFWRVELSRSGDALTASYRGVRVPVWVHSYEELSLAVALRRR